MDRIAIVEPDAELAALLAHLVVRAGDEPLVYRAIPADVPDGIACLLLESALPGAVELVERLRARDAELPILCFSLDPPGVELQTFRPAAYVEKPYGLAEVDGALRVALGRVDGVAQAA